MINFNAPQQAFRLIVSASCGSLTYMVNTGITAGKDWNCDTWDH